MIANLCMSFLIAAVIQPSLQHKLNYSSDATKISIIVHLKQKPNYTKIQNCCSNTEKIRYLEKFSYDSQVRIIVYLSNFSNEIESIKQYWIFNGLSLRATVNVIYALAKHPDIAFIAYDSKIVLTDYEPVVKDRDTLRSTEWNIQIIMADSCWESGYNGNGVIIGTIDSGVDTSHPALQGKWIDGGWYDAVNGLPFPYDDQGHGTFTMGIICGGDGLGPFDHDIGVAPDARYICAKAFDSSGSATYTALHDCFQWFATQNAKIIMNPWSENSTTSLEFWDDCLNLRSFGILLVFKIGTTTSAPPNSAKVPGNYPTVLGIGATDSLDNRESWSCRGPAPNQVPWNDTLYWFRTDWNLIKPDLVAPGRNIKSALLGGSYTIANGTSWAGAHVAGAAAILYHGDSTLNLTDIINYLLENIDYPPQGNPYPNNDYGWGRLNIFAALQAVLGTEEYCKQTPFEIKLYPNPCNGILYINFGKPIEENISVKIFDFLGRNIKTIVKQSKSNSKISTFRWNGLDDYNKKVGNGIYYIELRYKEKSLVQKIVYTK